MDKGMWTRAYGKGHIGKGTGARSKGQEHRGGQRNMGKSKPARAHGQELMNIDIWVRVHGYEQRYM